MATNNDNRAAMVFWGGRLTTVASRVAAFFAARISRLGIILLIILGTVYVAYVNVWRPILSTAPLPPGVAEKTPQLTTDLLLKIHAQRSARIEAPRQQYAVDTLVVPPVTAPQ